MTRSSIVLTLIAVWLVATPADAQSTARRTAKTPVKPGATFKECRNCPDMVVVPSGSFTIGSPADEPERRDNERTEADHHRQAVRHRQDRGHLGSVGSLRARPLVRRRRHRERAEDQ